jgi:hypothetical protein
LASRADSLAEYYAACQLLFEKGYRWVLSVFGAFFLPLFFFFSVFVAVSWP